MNKNRALGKGLASLLPRPQAQAPALAPGIAPTVPPPPPVILPVTELAIGAIQTNPNQPRKEFRQAQLLELAVSITPMASSSLSSSETLARRLLPNMNSLPVNAASVPRN
jgi:hypothetical protein